MPKMGYIQAELMFTENFERGREPIPHWAVWCDLIAKYQLAKTAGREIFRGAVVSLQNSLIWSHVALAALANRQILVLDQALTNQGAVIMPWQCGKCHRAYPKGAGGQRFHTDRDAIPSTPHRIHGKCV